MATRNIVGNVPEPHELYGREGLIDHLWRQLHANNVLLMAPRRFGKTGVMRHVLQKPRDGYLPVYLDLEDIDSPSEFVWRLTRELLAQDVLRSVLSNARRLPKALRGWFADTFDEIEFDGAKVKFKEEVEEGWRETGGRLLVEMEKAAPTVIFVLDELPTMLDNIRRKGGDEEAREFLAWFRNVRLQQKDRLRRYRFILAGSTSIDAILRRLNSLDKLNDFERLYVEPISQNDAQRLASDLAASLDVAWSGELSERMAELIGPAVPYFIHLLFSQVAQSPAEQRRSLTEDQLSQVYNRRVLGPSCKHYFDHYRGRLRRYGPRGERAALAMLRAVAESEHARVPASELYDVYRKTRKKGACEQEFNELMADLECDWYLVLDVHTNEYAFMLPVMKDWWSRWYPMARLKKPKRSK
ncbi:MAG: ATP-binding protein [Planctomycetia bacterium]|nr:ATP-binding protein [Planctomycetia bacterium]